MEVVALQELVFTDHMILTADLEKNLQDDLNTCQEELKKINMKISTYKTKTIMTIADKSHMVILEGKTLEQGKTFNYRVTIMENFTVK